MGVFFLFFFIVCCTRRSKTFFCQSTLLLVFQKFLQFINNINDLICQVKSSEVRFMETKEDIKCEIAGNITRQNPTKSAPKSNRFIIITLNDISLYEIAAKYESRLAKNQHFLGYRY